MANSSGAKGASSSLGTWVGVGQAVGRPLAVSFTRPTTVEVRDAGHLAIQELMLAHAERHRWGRHFELPTRTSTASLSVDVLLRLDAARVLLIIEIWNRLDDLGAAVRTTHRKQSEAAALALVAGGDGRAYRVATCWVLRDAAANRELVRRYPAIFRAEFPASSRAWTEAFRAGTAPPTESGVIWAHPSAGLSALNLRRPQ